MNVIGIEFFQSQLTEGGFTMKMVLNSHGAIFFPASQEHRDQKAPGISYADDYAGNALAAMVAPGKIEIRNHRDFSESHVTAIMTAMYQQPDLAPLRGWRVTYRGRDLRIVSEGI